MKSILAALALSAALAAPAYADIDVEAAKHEGALLRVPGAGGSRPALAP